MAITGLHRPPAGGVVTWMSPHSELWVAQVGGECAGIVEFVEGHFVVNGAAEATSRAFGSLLDAKRAIECPESSLDRREVPAHRGLAEWFGKRSAQAVPYRR